MNTNRSFLGTLQLNRLVIKLIVSLICCLSANTVLADGIISYSDIHHPVIGKLGMVSSQQRLASEAGLAVLQKGGNAVDSAVTMGFVLAVTLPRAGNLGGGGFMLVHLADQDKTVAIDYREKAPMAATQDMFIDANGHVDQSSSRFSLMSSGVPGTVAGMALALEQYGTISLKEAIEPAIKLALHGFIVDQDLATSLDKARPLLQRFPASQEIFYGKDGANFEVGDLFIQKDLAWSLQQISDQGIDAFYQGEIALKLVDYMANNNGIITVDDLKAYQPVTRQPVRGNYRGYEVLSMPPPSSGGVLLIHLLNLMERYPVGEWGHNTDRTVHQVVEAMRSAYADRSKWLGDTDFVDAPITGLLSKTYADSQAQGLPSDFARSSLMVGPSGTVPDDRESNETTHFSVVDQWGNAVSNTYTLNFSYGNGATIPGTGILLNNQMDDFAAKPGVQNAYGLIGSEFNAIAPEKRMLSSMAPTIVKKEGEVYLVTGSPGGSRIITTVLQILMNVIDHDMNIADATHAHRIHHQWWPDEIRVEKGFNRDTRLLLEQRRHKVVEHNAMGSSQSILRDNARLYGAADPRKPGAAALGY